MEQTTVNFHPTKIITQIVLCALFIIILGIAVFYSEISKQIIFLFLLFACLYVLIFRNLIQLLRHRNGKPGVNLTPLGLWNYTADTPTFVRWDEIRGFKHGFYRTNDQIFIEVSDPAKFERMNRSAYLHVFYRIGRLFRSKPNLLWIDVNLLDIKTQDLLTLLQLGLRKNKAQ